MKFFSIYDAAQKTPYGAKLLPIIFDEVDEYFRKYGSVISF